MLFFKRLVYLILLLFSASSLAQVGINTETPSAAAALDIESSNDGTNFGGLLPPRVTVAERAQIPVSSDDDGLMIFLQDGNQRILQLYNAVDGVWEDVYTFPVNDAPVAANLDIEGSLIQDETVTATFTYFDDENDPEGTHTYTWSRSASSDGSSPTTIQSGISNTYTLTAADVGNYIGFSVIPVATQGESPGDEVTSAFEGPVSAPFTPATDLFISEYVEGSGSNNKIIEVANYTGSTIDLTDYEIAGYQNGSLSANYIYTFPASSTLDNGDVYVISRSGSGYSGTPDDTFGWSFNGNDVVQLRASGASDGAASSIDILGTIGSTSNYAKDVTLRKKEETGPSTTYNAADYDSFPQNTFDGLGTHTY